MIKIIGKSLYQWDLNRQIEIDNLPDGTDITEVNFAHPGDEEALVVTPVKNGNTVIANIPNILLQSDKDIFIYVCVGDVTICSKRKNVHSRPRPADYVYTETQIMSYKTLEDRINNLDQVGDPGQVLTKMQDEIVSYNYPAVIDATKLSKYYYDGSNSVYQKFYIDLAKPILGRFSLPSKNTFIGISDGDPILFTKTVGTPNEVEVRIVTSSAVVFICKYMNGNISRYDYSVTDGTFTQTNYAMLPHVTADDNGKTLQVVNGKWTIV